MRAEDVYAALPTLTTERLMLRKLRAEDAADIFAYASDPQVSAYLNWEPHTTIAQAYLYIDGILRLYRKGEIAPWAVEHRADGRMIGTVAFARWSLADARAEFGYTLARPYWGRGLATEAAGAIIAFGFETMRLNRIEARCDPANTASARVLEKCGLRYEGTMRQHAAIRGAYRDQKLFSILRDEWPSNERA